MGLSPLRRDVPLCLRSLPQWWTHSSLRMQVPEAETMYSVPQRQQILQEALRGGRSKSQVTGSSSAVNPGQSTRRSESRKLQTLVKQLFLLKRIPRPHKGPATPVTAQSQSISPLQTLLRGKNKTPFSFITVHMHISALLLHPQQATLSSNAAILRSRINKSFFGHDANPLLPKGSVPRHFSTTRALPGHSSSVRIRQHLTRGTRAAQPGPRASPSSTCACSAHNSGKGDQKATVKELTVVLLSSTRFPELQRRDFSCQQVPSSAGNSPEQF